MPRRLHVLPNANMRRFSPGRHSDELGMIFLLTSWEETKLAPNRLRLGTAWQVRQ